MKITYNSFIFNLLAEEQINLPHYKGSTLRGAFGVAFKRVACALKRQNCTDCLLRTKCIYSQMFETNADGESPLGRVETVPRPFVIVPPETDNTVFEQNSEIKFTLTLIGRATEYLPYFVYAFQELGKMGIGSGRGKYTLLSVISENDGELIYSHDTQTLHSPQKNELDLGDAVSWFIEQDGEPSQSEVTL
ncbi:MAG: CRISPR-associated protein Cas6, partial [Nitrospirae bacterium]